MIAKKEANKLVNPLRTTNKSISHIYFKNWYWMDGNQLKVFLHYPNYIITLISSQITVSIFSIGMEQTYRNTELLRKLPQSTKISISMPHPLLQPPSSHPLLLKMRKKRRKQENFEKHGYLHFNRWTKTKLFQTECQPTNKIEITMRRQRISS